MTEQLSADWLGLAGRVCVVTGGGGGIGRAIAINLARAGALVAAIDRDDAGLSRTRAELHGSRHVIAPCDVTSRDSIVAAADTIGSTLGACQVLVNAAALLRPGSLDTLSLEEWNMVLSVNLTGYFLCAQIFGAQMRSQKRGSLVHVASIAGSHAQGRSGAYSVSKAGLVMLSRQLAVEWGPRGVRSNVVSPGMIRTPMTEAIYQAPGVHDARRRLVPAQRIGRPEDIADAVVFLASERASYITGEEIVVDGGFTKTIMSVIPRPGFEKN